MGSHGQERRLRGSTSPTTSSRTYFLAALSSPQHIVNNNNSSKMLAHLVAARLRHPVPQASQFPTHPHLGMLHPRVQQAHFFHAVDDMLLVSRSRPRSRPWQWLSLSRERERLARLRRSRLRRAWLRSRSMRSVLSFSSFSCLPRSRSRRAPGRGRRASRWLLLRLGRLRLRCGRRGGLQLQARLRVRRARWPPGISSSCSHARRRRRQPRPPAPASCARAARQAAAGHLLGFARERGAFRAGLQQHVQHVRIRRLP